jgi:hypothetical protein
MKANVLHIVRLAGLLAALTLPVTAGAQESVAEGTPDAKAEAPVGVLFTNVAVFDGTSASQQTNFRVHCTVE